MYKICRDGTAIYYTTLGSGYPIVFLHGNHLSSRYFKKQQFLSKSYRLIFIDSRGQGLSERQCHSFTFEDMAADVDEVLDELNINSCLLVGHSDGANLALVYQNRFPKRVAAMLLNAGNLSMFGLIAIVRLGVQLEVFFLSILSLLIRSFKSDLNVVKLMTQQLHLVPSSLQKNIPVWVLVGSRDFIKREHSKKIANLYPNGRLLTVIGEGHNIARTQPELFNQVICNMVEVIKEEDRK